MAAIISIVTMLMAFLTTSMAVVAMSPPPTGCATRELLLLSPCLPFISAPPNNLSDTVPSACCEAFSSAYSSGGGICLCYFLREPQILGFPLNRTKLIALSSFCPLNGESGMYLEKSSSLDSICAASRTLPPLHSSRIPRIQEPDSPADENIPAPDMGLPPSATVSPSAPADEPPPSLSSATTKRFSLAKDCIGLFFSGSLFLIHISSILEQLFDALCIAV
ncbi:non-specific lipid transfer protein GPI-anchored 25 [Benincasa hispida]|uniref:non-specific lipid transfer protein GPI-anchored 25 n=1 Tax=Benincasa hispida TaxID=102211 RepID=UPI00190200EF|nr:non-specific lipid transfer protein GPI-anchored 25 [Benincasa hispida]